MKLSVNKATAMLIACGSAMALSTAAIAQPYVVNVTGATLQQNFFQSLGCTQDFINADSERDSRAVYLPGSFSLATELQLAPGGRPAAATSTSAGWPVDSNSGNSAWWEVTYRAVGSGNGLLELSRYGLAPQTLASEPFIFAAAPANLNRTAYINAGVLAGTGNVANPGGSPVRGVATTVNISGTNYTRYQATFALPGTASAGGYLADVAPVDVIPEWFIGSVGVGDPNRYPAETGYGNNPLTAVKQDGTPALFTYPGELTPRAFASNFGALPNGVVTVSTLGRPVQATDTNVIFPTFSAYNSVAAVTNLGVAKSQVTYTDLRHLSVTGRTSTGENLMWVNRDVDSGTRNAFTTPLRLDSAWAVGENIGALSQLNDTADLGVSANGPFQPSQKGSSGNLERTVFNHRLAIGHSGSERGIGSSWLTNGQAEVLAVQDDIGERAVRNDKSSAVLTDPVTGTPLVGTQFVRPTVSAVANNGYIGQLDPSTGLPYTSDGYRIASLATLNTIGDPRMAPASKGGYGFTALYNAANPGTPLPLDPAGVNNPPMRNIEAAAFVNNITRAVEAYVIGADANFSPNDQLVRNFLLPQAVDRIPSATNPTAFTVNPNLIQSIQNDAPARSQLANVAYTSFGRGRQGQTDQFNGFVPRRGTRPSGTYSDGLAGNTFVTKGGTNLTGGTALNLSRNRVAGDFNGDGKRDVNDVAQLLQAYRWRTGTNAAWAPLAGTGSIAGAPGNDICVEILGDFDGNGSFDLQDVWYFCDGLATTAVGDQYTGYGNLNRQAGFAALDNASLAQTGNLNFFGTVLATAATYTAGASAADVAGPTGRVTPGYAPIGHDGRVDASDLDYIHRQFKRNPRVTDGALNWSNLSEAVRNVNAGGEICGDLSADVTGDLVIDHTDITFVVETILQTRLGDVDLDGRANYCDFKSALSHLGQNGGWAAGDVDGDGIVTADDLTVIRDNACMKDFNCDGNADPDDLGDFITCFFTDPPCLGSDFNGDGDVNPDDLGDYITIFFGPDCQ